MPGLKHQAGFTLLESLVATAILAVAVLGMLGAQLHTLADTLDSVRRAHAVRLIEDLAERIKTHPEGFRLSKTDAANWDAAPEPPDCRRSACNAEALAHWDLAVWKQAIADALPLGIGQVFETDDTTESRHTGQLGVMVAWRAGRRALADAGDRVGERLAINRGPADLACPAGLMCHLAYVQR
jgi:type IV pilus assembly protein PilV